jgi:hypothetical protein
LPTRRQLSVGKQVVYSFHRCDKGSAGTRPGRRSASQ